MKAALYDGTSQIKLSEIAAPSPGPGEVLVRIAACGICGTDLRILQHGHRKIPSGTERILGHELSGEVVEVGAGVRWPTPGVRVALSPNMGCGTCLSCTRGETQLCPDYFSFGVAIDGGFAELLLVPSEGLRQGNVVEIPVGMSYEAAALVEPLSCAYRGMMACNPKLGETVLIVGAGPMGLMHLQIARAFGAALVIVSSHSDVRAEQALQNGADFVANPKQESLADLVFDATHGKGVDIAIIAAPSADGQAESLELLAIHGRVNFFGGLPKGKETATIKSNLVHYRELAIIGTTGQSVEDFRIAMDLISSRKVNVESLVTGRFPLDKIHDAFDMARSKSGLKVLVNP